MDSLSSLLSNKSILNKKESKLQKWQDLALEIIKGTSDGDKFRGSIFGICEKDAHRAKIAWLDAQELGKPHSKYIFKVFHALNK